MFKLIKIYVGLQMALFYLNISAIKNRLYFSNKVIIKMNMVTVQTMVIFPILAIKAFEINIINIEVALHYFEMKFL